MNDLQQKDFRVFENGRPQALDRFLRRAASRSRIAIVLDTSLSMEGEKLRSAIASAVTFSPSCNTGDEGSRHRLFRQGRPSQDLTSDRGKLGGGHSCG